MQYNSEFVIKTTDETFKRFLSIYYSHFRVNHHNELNVHLFSTENFIQHAKTPSQSLKKLCKNSIPNQSNQKQIVLLAKGCHKIW